MKKQSKRQGKIEQIRKLLKHEYIRLNNWIVCGVSVPDGNKTVCHWCGYPAPVDLDELNGRHGVGALPLSVSPCNHQLLCRMCHARKTDGGNKDWLAVTQPKVKLEFIKLEVAIVNRLPKLPFAMKQNLDDIHNAVWEAIKENHEITPKRKAPSSD